MKFNRIISSALTVVMLFMAIVGIIPAVEAEAAYTSSQDQSNLTLEQVQKIVNDATAYDFDNAQQMLDYELSQGYLVSVTSSEGEYSIFVNRYTGVLYYKNNLTGQILTSNTYSFKNEATPVRKELLSQILIEFNEVTSSNPENQTYNSFNWAASYGQISTELISGGIRVNYTLGDTTKRFLLPGRITAAKLESMVFIPMLEELASLLEQYCGDSSDMVFSVFENEDYIAYKAGCLNKGTSGSHGISDYLKDIGKFVQEQRKSGYITRDEANVIDTLRSNLSSLMGSYNLQNPAAYEVGSPTYNTVIDRYYTPKEGVRDDLEIFTTLEAMYILGEPTVAGKRSASARFTKYATEYTFNDMYEDEEYCGYVDEEAQKPVFRCALEYTFNKDGSLSVRLPANSITFDETVYIVYSITPLPYFGAGNQTESGYAFYPDGSGAVVDFEDFYGKANIKMDKQVYGTDYAYSEITGKHHEQASIPVYGIVNEVAANPITSALTGKDKVTNGFLAIIEQGESLATIGLRTLSATHRFAYAFSSYTPYPSDKYDLSDQISVGNNESYVMTAETKFNGSYVTRYVMLSDATAGAAINAISGGNCAIYPASYVGMATYYREFLKGDGTLTALENTTEKLPLYIEALGSMEIVKKILSFPVTAKLELTTFDDIYTMYEELADAKNKFLEKAQEFEAKAEETNDETLKASYKATAENYRALSAEVVDIVNVNFRLTGFGNGGLNATYPTKVRWDKACGGEEGLEALIAKAQAVSADLGASLGIFPEYDFMYLNYTEPFDGFIKTGNVSRMIDNRYASKQTYNSVIGMYESFFTMVVNPASLEALYSKFISQYSKYPLTGISVSTLGSDLNSNFDEKEPVNRDEAMTYVKSVLNKMVYQSDYELMTNVGNAYALKYVDHIIEAATDSSHMRYTSYTVPFVGMVLHGYVNYTGSAINYAGNQEYDILRSIESGASLYYILCYQNSSYLKDDHELSKYYGVDYSTWYDQIVTTYAELNAAIGDLQTYQIVDHKILLGERVISESERVANAVLLKAEMLQELANELQERIDAAYADIRANEALYPTGTVLVLEIDTDAILSQFADDLGIATVDELDSEFKTAVESCIGKFEAEYEASAGAAVATYQVQVDSVEYTSKYSFITESYATDKNYVYTDFTSDVNNIVLVTYSNGTETVKFILNYNIYSVTVRLDDGEVYTLDKYSYVRIEEGGNG